MCPAEIKVFILGQNDLFGRTKSVKSVLSHGIESLPGNGTVSLNYGNVVLEVPVGKALDINAKNVDLSEFNGFNRLEFRKGFVSYETKDRRVLVSAIKEGSLFRRRQ